MYHLLAAALIFAFGVASTLATTRALQQWATSKYDAAEVSVGADTAARPLESPNRVHR